MTDKIDITGPVEIKDNSTERVAFDLMNLIAKHELGSAFAPDENYLKLQQSREYWLKLYAQCRSVTVGRSLATAMKE